MAMPAKKPKPKGKTEDQLGWSKPKMVPSGKKAEAKKSVAKTVTPRGPARLSYGYPLSKQSVEANQRIMDVKGQEKKAVAAAKKSAEKQAAKKKAAKETSAKIAKQRDYRKPSAKLS